VWRWLHERGKVSARDINGKAQHFAGVCFCIDDRKKIEARYARPKIDMNSPSARRDYRSGNTTSSATP